MVVTIEDAIAYAAKAHKGQVDKEGLAYIYHPLAVTAFVRDAGFDESYQIVAVLHDVVEDTNVTLSDIEDFFGYATRVAVDHLTRRKGESYEDFLIRAKTNERSSVVKYYDMYHNRSKCIKSGKYPNLLKRYDKGLGSYEYAPLPN